MVKTRLLTVHYRQSIYIQGGHTAREGKCREE